MKNINAIFHWQFDIPRATKWYGIITGLHGSFCGERGIAIAKGKNITTFRPIGIVCAKSSMAIANGKGIANFQRCVIFLARRSETVAIT